MHRTLAGRRGVRRCAGVRREVGCAWTRVGVVAQGGGVRRGDAPTPRRFSSATSTTSMAGGSIASASTGLHLGVVAQGGARGGHGCKGTHGTLDAGRSGRENTRAVQGERGAGGDTR